MNEYKHQIRAIFDEINPIERCEEILFDVTQMQYDIKDKHFTKAKLTSWLQILKSKEESLLSHITQLNSKIIDEVS